MLRRRILLSTVVGLLLAVAAGVLGQAYAAGLPDEYTAESVVIFGSRPTDNGGVTGSDSVQSAAAGYVAYLTAPSTLREISENIGEDSAALKDGLTATQLPATATIRIGYQSGDPDRAARGANALAAAVTTRAISDPVVYAQVLARAAVPLAPSGPPRTILLAASFVVAVVVGAGAATATWTVSGLLARRRLAGPRESGRPVPGGAAADPRTATAERGPVDADQAVRDRLASITGAVAGAVAARRPADRTNPATDGGPMAETPLDPHRSPSTTAGSAGPVTSTTESGAAEDGESEAVDVPTDDGSPAAEAGAADDAAESPDDESGAAADDAAESPGDDEPADTAEVEPRADADERALDGAPPPEGSAARPAPRQGGRRGPRRRTSGQRTRKPR